MSIDLSKMNLNAVMPKMPSALDYVRDVGPISLPNMAENAVEAIYEEIADFEATLDSDHETGMPIVGGPAGLCVHVREVYRFGRDKLVFGALFTVGSRATVATTCQHGSSLRRGTRERLRSHRQCIN